MQYRVRYQIWRVNADSAEQAKRYVVETMTKHAALNISVEPLQSNSSLLKQLLFGR